MVDLLRLAWRHLAHHPLRSSLLVVALALTLVIPIGVERLLSQVDREVDARTESTPLVVGARGSRFDLVLSALFFRGRVPDPVPVGVVDRICRDERAVEAIPLRLGLTARDAPLVGTTPDYFGFRALRFRQGSPPLQLGECVLGAAVAERLESGLGSKVLTDTGSLFQLDQGYPLRMPVVGILERTEGPDDEAVFVSLPTAWVVEGLGHGHGEDPSAVESGPPTDRVYDQSLRTYQEITDENRGSFHFHGDPDDLPITAVLVRARDEESATVLQGRLAGERELQLLVPGSVLGEIREFVFQLKRVFDANVLLVLVSTLLMLTLVVVLSVRVRSREFETLMRLGASRPWIAALVGIEYLVLAAFGTLFAWLGALAIEAAVDNLSQWT